MPSVRNLIFAVTVALIGGQPIPITFGGGESTSDLPWDGRRPDEAENAYRCRSMKTAATVIMRSKQGYQRR